MNLSVSSVNNKNICFGMAKFSEPGRRLAQNCSDLYEGFSRPNLPEPSKLNPEFTKRILPFQTVPFEEYIKTKIPISAEEANPLDTKEVAQVIIDHGTTDDQQINANFVKQLLKGEGFIRVAEPETKKQLSLAVRQVFDKNWDNPKLSKKQTLALLEAAKFAMDDKEYAVALGVIQKSDIRE